MNHSWNFNDFLRQISIAPAPKRRRKPRFHRYEALEPRAMLATNYVASISGESNAPEGGTGGFTISVSPAVSLGEYVVVGYGLSGSAADPDQDFPSDGAVTFSGTTTTAVGSIPSGTDDEGDAGEVESLTMTLAGAIVYDNSFTHDTASVGTPATASINITEGTGVATPGISVDGSSADEGLPINFTVNYWGMAVGTPIAYFTYGNGPDDATAGVDYTAVTGTTDATAAAGSFTVAVYTIDDDPSPQEPNQNVNLSASGGGASSDGTGVILEDGDPASSVTVSGASGLEGDTLTFSVNYSELPIGTVIDLATIAGTATPNTDYQPTPIPSAVTVTATTGGEPVKVVSIDDHADEDGASQTFTLTAVGYDAYGIGTITEDADSDDNEPSVSIGDASITEPYSGTTTMVFTVSLSNKVDQPVDVPYHTIDGSATTQDGDYVGQTGTLVIPAMQPTATIAVTINADAWQPTDPEDFYVTLTAPVVNATLGSPSEGTGTIQQLPEPSVTIENSSAPETQGPMTFTLTLSAPVNTQNIVVTYKTIDGSATNGVDYTGTTNGTAEIPAGETTGFITIPLIDDDQKISNEPNNQDFSVSLLSIEANGVVLGNSMATGTINEDSDPLPKVFIYDAITSEQAPVMTFAVELSPPSALEVDVPFYTKDGSATQGVDYQSVTGMVVFPPSATLEYIDVPIINDTTLDDPITLTAAAGKNSPVLVLDEPIQDFTVNLEPPTNATLGRATGTGYIYDDGTNTTPLNCVCTCTCPVPESTPNSASGANNIKVGGGPESPGEPSAEEAHPGESDPRAVIAVSDELTPNVTGAADVKVAFTFGTLTSTTVYYSPANYTAGETVDFAQEVSIPATLASGQYPWTMTVSEEFADSVQNATRVYTGNYDLLNLDQSHFGVGWTLQELDQLDPVSGGVDLADGMGNMYYFASSGTGTFTSPADAPNFATLRQNSDGSYTLIDAQGNVENFDSAGYLTDQVDANGNTTSYDFSGGLLQKITDQAGRSEVFSYETVGTLTLLANLTDIHGRTTEYGYDPDGHLTEVLGPDPGNGEARLTSTFTYDNAGDILTASGADGTTSYTYDSYGALVSATDPDGHVTGYDAPQDQAFPASGNGTLQAPYALVDDASIEGTSTDGNGHVTTYSTGIYGAVTSSTDASEATTDTVYNAAGQPLTITGPELTSGPDAGMANVTSFTYDGYGNVIEEVLPDDATESWVYDVDVPGGTHFDEPVSYTDHEGRTTLWTLDANTGNVLSMTEVGVGSPSRVTQYTYTSKPTAQGQVPGGLLATEIDPRGIETEYFYNSHGLATEVIQAANSTAPTTMSMAYDAQDDLISQTDQDDRTTFFRVDGLGRTIETDSPPPTASVTSVYPISYATYDALDRVISETEVRSMQPATVELVTDYTYEPGGGDDSANVEQESTYGVTISAGITTTTTYSVATHGYDGADNQTSYIDGMGRTTLWQFDSTDEQIAEQDPSPNSPGPNGGGNNGSFGYGTADGPLTSLVYDPLGNVVQSFDANQNETDNAYDLSGDLVSTTGPAPTSGAARPVTSYAYDHDHEITSEVDARGAVTQLFYNEFGELVKRIDPSPSAPGTPNPAPSPVTTFQYDGDGNLVSEVGPNGGQTQFIYNAFNEMVEEVGPSPDGVTPGATTQWLYDPAGQLTATIDPGTASMSRETQFIYDGDGDLIATIAPDLATGGPGNSGTTTTDTYDLAGDKLTEISPVPSGATAAPTTTWFYNALGEVTEEIDPSPDGVAAGPTWQYFYNADQQVTETIDPLGRTETTAFDGLGPGHSNGRLYRRHDRLPLRPALRVAGDHGGRRHEPGAGDHGSLRQPGPRDAFHRRQQRGNVLFLRPGRQHDQPDR